ncbi:MAG: DUF1553 domain-containing protein [Planctomycetaceae bacterium]|nr:MAG: DUF1553 domain-containing protein [Planctomycetaceae bacterium]
MFFRSFLTVLPGFTCFWIGLLSIGLVSLWADSVPDFNREVRPILSQHCFKCHGPDEATRMSGLRLDYRQDALAVIVPGDPEQSELVRRVFSSSDFEVMPPPEAKLPMTDQQRDVLRRWVEGGADYQPHWAFVAPQKPPLPEVQPSDWPQRPLDHFVLEQLEARGRSPASQADRATLIRRVSLDLIGLPPTPDQVDQFIADDAPDAYERLVDRLLASEHYGERWARQWLDLARYADTNGYEKDRPRSIWPYRDWVIHALNDGMPFDQFTIEQIAGDLLPEATLDQRIATGFHRNTMLNEEGGIDPLEFRFHAMTDRVATTGTAWLGLTLGCAQCHTHKYDPVSHHEYFGVMALLNNADEPELELPQEDLDAQHHRNVQQAEQLLAQLPEQFPVDEEGDQPIDERRRAELDRRWADWLLQQRSAAVEWTPWRPVEAASNLPLLTVQPDDSVFASGDFTKDDTYRLRFAAPKREIYAVRLEALPDPRLPAGGPGMTYYEGTKGDFFLGVFQLSDGQQPLPIAGASASYAKNRFGNNPVSAELTLDGDPQTGWSVHDRTGERHVAVYVLDPPWSGETDLHLTMTFGRHFSSSLGRFRISVTSDPRAGQALDLPEQADQWLPLPESQWPDQVRESLWHAFLLSLPELAEPAKKIQQLRKRPEYPTTLVMQERPPENPRPTHLHHRGEFLEPQEQVDPGVPVFLPPLPADQPPNRLTFARWLVSEDNPLTARVTVNRHWAAFFGNGLVPTIDDFGYQGQMPTHPELLDWLAVRFMQSGWSLKWLHQEIVMSATYQQSSRVTEELAQWDPDNRWLARGPRVRLEAELIRDGALLSSGLLSDTLGGPSVFPPQPEGVTTEGTYGPLTWKASTGPDRYRRSLYTFIKRTAPFAMYNTFDAPTGESCVARRDVSNTPLQALTLMNDVVFLEAAQALGKEFSERDEPLEDRMTLMFRRVVVRSPDPEELDALVAFYHDQRARFENDQLDAAAVAGQADGNPVAQAVWTVIARILLNLDETITKT